jgi:hypothetical protein
MIIAVDPGEMCGLIAIYSDGTLAFSMEAPPYETVSWVDAKPMIAPDCRLVAERYVITQATVKMTRQTAALETIGALRYVASRHRIPFSLQNRGDRHKVTNDQLRQLGWFMPTKDGHANDAARHAWLAFMGYYPNHDLVKQMLDTI